VSAGAAFACQRCGHCCQGQGGIVLTLEDMARLADHLGLDLAGFLSKHTESRGGKACLTTGPDGFCEFFDTAQSGCGVHVARPDVCRAWPFFRGNLLDESSWSMIQDDCPGVNPAAGHAEFARQGRAYLAEHGLAKAPGCGAPCALVLPEDSEGAPPCPGKDAP
jgi:uncharacterized protein